MKNLLSFIAIITLPFLFACDNNKQTGADEERSKNVAALLSQYKEITFDTLKVASESESNPGKGTFTGTPMDSAGVALLPKPFRDANLPQEFFACYQFRIDEHTTGLITRVLSTYESSSIVLILFDHKKQVCLPDYIELAEAFGDAGDVLVKTSWLMREKDKFSTFIHVEESHDNSVEDSGDTTQESWDYYYLVNIEKQKADTVSKDNEYLKTKFGHLFLPRPL